MPEPFVLRVEAYTHGDVEEPLVVLANGVPMPRLRDDLWAYELEFEAFEAARHHLPLQFVCKIGEDFCGVLEVPRLPLRALGLRRSTRSSLSNQLTP